MTRHLASATAVVFALFFIACQDAPEEAVDDTPPQVEIAEGPSSTTNRADATFDFDCNVDWCLYNCRINDGEAQSCSPPVALDDLDDGEHTLAVTAVDRHGNVSDPAHWQWRIDTSAPDLDWKSPPDVDATDPTARFDFGCTDTDCQQFECSTHRPGDDPAYEPCTPPAELDQLESGRHIFAVRTSDDIGNRAELNFDWTIDPVDWKRVDAGATHSCATTTDNDLYCWGHNQYGQLGIGDDIAYTTHPRRVADDQLHAGITDVSVGRDHTCAIGDDATLWCWGRNHRGQLGSGDTDNRDAPVQHDGNWRQLATSDARTCAIRTDGSLWCWGRRGHAGLGTSNEDEEATALTRPGRVTGADGRGHWSDWTDVDPGPHHICGVRAGGSLWCWGEGADGRLGIGAVADDDQPTVAAAPPAMPGPAMGAPGMGGSGQHGLPTSVPGQPSDGESAAVRFGGPPDDLDEETLARLEAGDIDPVEDAELLQTLRRTNERTYREMEQHFAEQDNPMPPELAAQNPQNYPMHRPDPSQRPNIDNLGEQLEAALAPTMRSSSNEPDTTVASPQRVVDTDGDGHWSDWVEVTVGSVHSCATRADGSLWCWGNNANRRLGIDDSGRQFTPRRVGADTVDWTDLTAGESHTCALRRGTTPWCWGRRADGRLGIAPDIGRDESPVNPIQLDNVDDDLTWQIAAAGNAHTCATTDDGQLYCWGSNRYGQLGDDTTARRTSPTPVAQP